MFSLPIIDKLVLRGIIGPYLLSFFIVEFVLVMQFLWQKIDNILGKGYGLIDYLELIGYFSLVVIPMSLPLTVLLSTVMIYGDMSEKYELTALKSAGISLLRIFRPGLIMAILTCLVSLFASNILKPEANEKFLKKIRDMQTNQLTFVFDEKVFNQELKNFSIYIDKKYPDGQTIEGIQIYDLSDPDKSLFHLISAARGRMYTTADKKFLIMELENGYIHKEIRAETTDASVKGFNQQARPVSHVKFGQLRKAFELSELLDLKVVSSNYRDYDMMNVIELKNSCDSITALQREKINQSLYDFNGLIEYDSLVTPSENSMDTLHKNVSRATTEQDDNNIDTKAQLSHLTLSVPKPPKAWPIWLTAVGDSTQDQGMLAFVKPYRKDEIIKGALNTIRARHHKNKQIDTELTGLSRRYSRYSFRFHQQFSWALVCILFLFIGAPAGAIVRKGGFGFPLLIAIIFYMIFIMSSIMGEKLMRSDSLSAHLAAWIPCYLLLPFTIVLTYMALHDRKLRDINIPIFRRIFRKKKTA